MLTIPVFAGLGSDVLFNETTADQAKFDSRTSSSQVLLNSCHRVFIEELSPASSQTKLPLRIDLDDFKGPEDILRPCELYHQHPVVQHAALCVVQLLRYLNTFERKGCEAVAASGFCAGLFAAVAAATSASPVQFLGRAEECFRAAILVGIASEQAAREIRPLRSSAPWSLIVANIEFESISELISNYNAASTQSRSIYISSKNSQSCVTLSGEGEELHEFAKSQLPSRCIVRPTNLWSPYHDVKLTESRDWLLRDFESRQLPFASRKDLLIPLISTADGALIEHESQSDRNDLLEQILDLILITPTDWVAVQDRIISLANAGQAEVCNYGPGYGFRDPLSQVQVRDMYSDPFGPHGHENDVAIIGVGVDLPDAPDLDTLWKNLLEGLNSCSEIPTDRFHVEDYYNRNGYTPVDGRRTMGTKFGNFLDDPFLFDNQLFDISPREAASIDPQQRVMLQTVYRSLENAGYVPGSTVSFARETFGCFIGNATLDYIDNLKNNIDVYYSPGTLRAFISGRISYAFKWSGPSITLDTACSSSLVALHQAVRALAAGDCQAAVAGGVNIISSPNMYLGLDRARFLSSTGQCKAFDEAADGYCRGEGCAAFVLKRLDDAIRENDRVLGVIRGIAVNQSGQASSITHPHPASQEQLFKRLLSESKIRPHDVSVVEAHGTGTQAGDPNELRSIRSALCTGRNAQNPLHITSIKSNIGHTEAASGSASLAKLLLMLRHKRIPPQAQLNRLNPAIDDLDLDGSIISTESREWKSKPGRKRIALLNNFGAAGSNAALLLEEYRNPESACVEQLDQLTYVFGASARSEEQLQHLRKDLLQFLAVQGGNIALSDVCYSSTARRALHKYRLSISATSIDDLRMKLAGAPILELEGRQQPTVFMFSGQGSQYIGMGRDLYTMCPTFRKKVDLCNEYLISWGFPGCLEILQSNDAETLSSGDVETIQALQSSVFVIEVALAQLLIELGIKPNMLIGHSLGEYAALVIAGVLDMESGLWLVARRAALITQQCKLWESSMLAVNMSAHQMRQELLAQPQFAQLSVACENSPNDCVVGGEKNTLLHLRSYIDAHFKKRCAWLDVPLAYHTAAMDSIMDNLTEAASQVSLSAPSIPIASNVFGRVIKPGEGVFTHQYFANHCRQPVAFDSSVADILHNAEFAAARWIEIGPHPILLPILRSSIESSDLIPTLRKDQHASRTLADLFSSYYKSGHEIKWRSVFDQIFHGGRLIDLPPMPMNLRRFHIPLERERPQILQSDCDASLQNTGFALLEHVVPTEDKALAIFETSIQRLESLIKGHQVCGKALCPASVYAEMALAAITYVESTNSEQWAFKLADLVFSRPLILNENSLQTVRITIKGIDSPHGDLSFEVSSFDKDDGPSQTKTHCTGKIKRQSRLKAIRKMEISEHALARRKAAFQNDECQTFLANTMYKKIFTRVVQYAPLYQAIRKIYLDDEAEEIYAVCELPSSDLDESYAGQPILLDTMLHAAGFAANLNVDNQTVCICHQVHSMLMLRSGLKAGHKFEVHCSTFTTRSDPEIVLADAHAVDETGITAVIKGMEFRRMDLAKVQGTFGIIARELPREAGAPFNPPQQIELPKILRDDYMAYILDDSNSSMDGATEVLTPDQAIDILSETTGVHRRDITSQTELNSMGVDSMMVFELEKRLEKVSRQKATVAELSALKTVGDFEQLVSAGPSRIGSPLLRIDTSHARGRSPALSRQRSLLGTPVEQTQPVNQGAEHEVAPEMMELLRIRLGMEEQPERLQRQSETSNAPPLWLVHPGAGMCHLFRRIGPLDRTLLAIHDPRIFSDLSSDWTCIDDIAEHYATMIRDQSSSSGIILGGWSFGGVVAFEAARLLLERGGVRVLGVVLIDPPPPFNHVPMTQELVELATPRKASHLSLPRDRNAAEFDEALRSLTIRNNLRRATLLQRHQPKRTGPMPRVILLRSAESLQIPTPHLPINEWLQDRSNPRTCLDGWEELTGGEVEYMDIPGDHFTPFEPRNVEGTTLAIRKACEMLEGVGDLL